MLREPYRPTGGVSRPNELRVIAPVPCLLGFGSALLDVLVLVIGAGALIAVTFTTGAIQLTAFTVLIGVVVLRHSGEVTQPITWFGPVFWLYSASYPALAAIGFYPYDAFLQHAVLLHALAFVAFAIPLFGCRVPLWLNHWRESRCRMRYGVAQLSFILLVPLVALLLVHASYLGATSKRELLEAGSALMSMLSVILTVMTFLYVVALTTSRHAQRSILYPFALACLVFGPVLVVAGERDFLLRAIVVFALVWWDFNRRPRLWVLALAGCAIIAVLPLLQSLKAVALGGPVSYQFELASVFSQEFRVMTQNTYFVLSLGVDRLVDPFAPLLWDLKRAVLPQILGVATASTNAWFNDAILFDVDSGRGFTLVGFAYLVGHEPAVVIFYLILGCLYRWLYVRRSGSYISFAMFMMMAPLLMYVQRGDLSAFLAPLIRAVLLPALVFLLIVWLARQLLSAATGERSASSGLRGAALIGVRANASSQSTRELT